MKKLHVEGRYLAWDNGEPFFYLADTAWEIFHRLNRDEMQHYLSERARQGFTAVQGVALAECEGLTVPNAYGRLPLLFTDGMPDPTRPDLGDGYHYWAQVDFAVEAAAKNGLFFAMLPTWGDKFNIMGGKGPEVFTVENAFLYGKWIAERYADKWNVIWMLGGDRPLEEEHRKIMDAMAVGIREVDRTHLITFHPRGGQKSTDFVGDAPYIDFHTSQTGHRVGAMESHRMMLAMAAQTEKPYLDSEPRYEDHPVNFNAKLGHYWNAVDVRHNAYWNVLTGACGHTYGNHAVWSMNRIPTSYFPYTWQDALVHEGARQMGFLRKLRMSRPYFSLRYAPELLDENLPGMGHMVGALGEGYAYVYTPLGVPFTVNLERFKQGQAVRVLWFDPRTGEETVVCFLPPVGKSLVVPPTQGFGCDWVLILEQVD